MYSQLPLTALRAFEASARLQSFKAAACELHVTPTAVSHQIQQIELYLGLKLFERVHRGLVLTDAAIAMLPHVQQGFAALNAAVAAVHPLRDTGSLLVSAPPSFAMRVLMPLSHDFLAKHPSIDLRVTTRMREPLLDSLGLSNEIDTLRQWAEDCDILILYGGKNFNALGAEKLMSLTLRLVCSPKLIEESGLCGCDDVFRFPWLHDDRGLKYGGSSFWGQWLIAAGLSAQETSMPSAHYTHAALAIEAAVRGQGLLVTTDCLCRKELKSGELIAPFDLAVTIDNAYFVLSRKSERPTNRQFMSWLRSAVANHNLIQTI